MTRVTALEAAFDAAFIARAPGHGVRPEMPDDRAFLDALFAAVSPLRDMLPPVMLEQQARAADAQYRAEFPLATRRIATRDGQPVGRIMLDWTAGTRALGIDIAVLPDDPRARGVGLAMLRAWVAVADAAALPARLSVVADNPAQHIYRRLGFVALAGDPSDPMIRMDRPVAGR